MSTIKNIATKLMVAIFTVYQVPSVLAQETDDSTVEDKEVIIITGVAQPTTKLESTNSVTSLQKDEITNFAPRSTAEIFRNLPGIQSEHTGGDSVLRGSSIR